MHGTRPPPPARPGSRAISIRIARDPNDLMLVTAIRAAVYLAEQDCPIEEEFDGNDLVAAHFIGFVGRNRRAAFGCDFRRVRQGRTSRRPPSVPAIAGFVQAGAGELRLHQAQGIQEGLWPRPGQAGQFLGAFRRQAARPRPQDHLSDFSYTEMVLDLEPGADAITLDSDPYVIIRPEGDWDRPGVLDISSGRAATSPLRTIALAET